MSALTDRWLVLLGTGSCTATSPSTPADPGKGSLVVTVPIPDPLRDPPRLVLDRYGVELWHGNCLDVLRAIPDESVHAIITDPPYGLNALPAGAVADTITRWIGGEREHTPAGRGMMAAAWDAFVPPPAVWDECYRILKPGGHLLVFCAGRTQDLMGLSIRLAGFDIRDMIGWIQAGRFPKNLDVAREIDRLAGAERAREPGAASGGYASVNRRNATVHGYRPGVYDNDGAGNTRYSGVPVTDEAAAWDGWGTALKAALEPVTVARKPLGRGLTVAGNVLEHGTGAINVDATRIGFASEGDAERTARKNAHGQFGSAPGGNRVYGDYTGSAKVDYDTSKGRWPTNVVFAHAPECGESPDVGCVEGCQVAELDGQSGWLTSSRKGAPRSGASGGTGFATTATGAEYDDEGGASRFFPVFRYEPRATDRERPRVGGVEHSTVKPLALMRWLVRLVAPSEGLVSGSVVVDPFAGSGTTAEACLLEGVRCVVVEQDARYVPLIEQRVFRQREPGSVRVDEGAGESPDTLF